MKLKELAKVTINIDTRAQAQHVSELLALKDGAGGCGCYDDAFVEKANRIYTERFGSKPLDDVYQEVLRIAGEWNVKAVHPYNYTLFVELWIPEPEMTAEKGS